MKNYHFAVFIGRFQPYHNGHHHIISQGLQRAEKIIILCGSAHLPVSHRNPWSFQQRKTMILNSFSHADFAPSPELVNAVMIITGIGMGADTVDKFSHKKKDETEG